MKQRIEKERCHLIRNKLFGILFIAVLITLGSGCGDRTQIEDRDFVLAAGISYEDDKYKLSAARPDLSMLTGQGAPENENFVVTYEGSNFYNIEKKYSSNSDKMLDFSHLKAFILDYKIVSDKNKIKDFLQYIQNNYKISRNTLVFYSDVPQEEILNLNNNVNGNIGEYLEQIYNNNVVKMYEKKATIGDYIQLLYESDKVEMIPKIIIKDKKPAISGAGLFQNGILVKSLSDSELESISLLKGTGENYDIFLDRDIVVRIKNIKKVYHYTINRRIPYILIEIKGNAQVIQNPEKEEIEKLKNDTDTLIENTVITSLNDIMKKEKIDFLNLYRTSAYKDKDIWIYYKDRQEEFIDNLDFRVTANFHIIN